MPVACNKSLAKFYNLIQSCLHTETHRNCISKDYRAYTQQKMLGVATLDCVRGKSCTFSNPIKVRFFYINLSKYFLTHSIYLQTFHCTTAQ